MTDSISSFYYVTQKKGRSRGKNALGWAIFSPSRTTDAQAEEEKENGLTQQNKKIKAFVILDGKEYKLDKLKIKNVKHLEVRKVENPELLFLASLSEEEQNILFKKINELEKKFASEYNFTFQKQNKSQKSRRLLKQKMANNQKKQRRQWLKFCKDNKKSELKKLLKKEQNLCLLINAKVRKYLKKIVLENN